MKLDPIVVLVVDDDEPTRLYLSREIEKEGYHVLTANDGKEALGLIQTRSLDMVLLDIIMPEMSGFQVLQYLKTEPALRSIPVIMISAAGDVDKAVRCIALGAEDYLTKPLNPILLRARINAHLERKWLRDQERAYLRQLQAEKAEAEAAHRAKSAFIANMSHELRTPLNAIIGYSEILQEDMQEEGLVTFLPDLDKIHNSGKHLLQLIDGILDLAKIESGRMELHLEHFELYPLITQLIETIRPVAAANGNTIEVQMGGLGSMYADLGKVRQVLWNLLDNAAKFTENGTITLTIERDRSSQPSHHAMPSDEFTTFDEHPPLSLTPAPDWITFRITDTGIGIPPEHQAQIFGVFTQGDGSTTRKYGGTGLGLTLCHRFCQLLGGSIGLVSRVNHGSTFIVRLPAEVEREPERQAEGGIHPEAEDMTELEKINPFGRIPSLEPSAPSTQPFCHAGLILVIDDDRTVRDAMVQMLNEEGYRVVTTWHGGEGLRLARELAPTLIVLDMQLPEMDSWMVLSALKADPTLSRIPVVMQTLVNPQAAMAQSSHGFVLGVCDRLTDAEDFKRLTTQLQPFQYRPKANESLMGDHILLVQPDQTTQQILQRLLTKSGWTVTTADRLETALLYMEKKTPDLIVLDLMLPDQASFQFLAQVQHHPKWQSIPAVAVLTVDPSPADRHSLNQGIEYLWQQGSPPPDRLRQRIRDAVLAHLYLPIA